MKPIALVDMDGTVADFDGGMTACISSLSPAQQEEPNVRKRIKRMPGFWRHLSPIQRGLDVVEMLRAADFQIQVLSKGPRGIPNAWAEKVQWVDAYLGEDTPINLVSDVEGKGLVYGKLLVDDWPPYVTSWVNARPRGIVLMPDQPWNRDFSHPRVHRFVAAEDVREVITTFRQGLALGPEPGVDRDP